MSSRKRSLHSNGPSVACGWPASERNVVIREVVHRRRTLGRCVAAWRGLRSLRPCGAWRRAFLPLFATAFAATAQHLHVVADDVGRVVLHAVLVVGAVFDPPLDVDLATL